MKDKEIEVKFVINKTTKNKLIKYLEKNAQKESEFRLIDTYYVPNFKSFEVDGETVECVRIREKGKAQLTYKKIHKDATPVYCDEFETEISSAEQTEKILFALGFSVDIKIDKTRTTYKMGEFEFDFDSVKNLGELLEIELKEENADISKIFDFVKNFGLSKKDVTYAGIQNLMKGSK